MKKNGLPIITVLIILCTLILIYRPTLFDFFIADDFFYMAWLKLTKSCPQLLWQVYVFPISPTDSRVTVFYRPLFTTWLFLENQVWGFNSVGFRLGNLLVETLSGLTLSLIVLQLKIDTDAEPLIANKERLSWAFLAAILFVYILCIAKLLIG